jgi:hypothetical protein
MIGCRAQARHVKNSAQARHVKNSAQARHVKELGASAPRP